MKKTLAVIGLGMLACSLGASLKKSSFRRIGWARRKETVQWAVEHEVIEEPCASPEEAFAKADLAILCLPVPVIMKFLQTYSGAMKHCVVTDIGSVKGCIERAGKKAGVRFVGSHPMAGTEKSGAEAYVPGIYANAPVFVVPPEGAAEEDILLTEQLWLEAGALPSRIGAQEHDLLVAYTSHVPHIVSSALALSVLDAEGELRELRFKGCASGFRDTIRVAASSPRMWREILSHNKEAVLEAVTSFESCFVRLKAAIAENRFDDFERDFAHGKELVEEWWRIKKIR